MVLHLNDDRKDCLAQCVLWLASLNSAKLKHHFPSLLMTLSLVFFISPSTLFSLLAELAPFSNSSFPAFFSFYLPLSFLLSLFALSMYILITLILFVGVYIRGLPCAYHQLLNDRVAPIIHIAHLVCHIGSQIFWRIACAHFE